MKVIWSRLWYDKPNKLLRNSNFFLKNTLDWIWISNLAKESKVKNKNFKDVLLDSIDDLDWIHIHLWIKWYKVLKIFRNELSLKKYVKENKIKTKIKNWEILIWNVYSDENIVECVWIVLAIENLNVENQVNTILEK